MNPLGNFRTRKAGETPAAYFKAAVFKVAKKMKQDDESAIHRFVSTVIGRSQGDQDYKKAYEYAIVRFEAKGELHLNAEDLAEQKAAGLRSAECQDNKTHYQGFLGQVIPPHPQPKVISEQTTLRPKSLRLSGNWDSMTLILDLKTRC